MNCTKMKNKVKKIIGKAAAALLASVMILSQAGAMSVFAYTNQYGVCTATSLNVRSGAGTTYSKTGILYEGETVTVTGEKKDSDGTVWYAVTYSGGSGYVSSKYINVSQSAASGDDSDFEAYMDEQGFPESYKPYLRQMHKLHPNWIFTAQKLGVDWNEAVTAEMTVGRNLVHSSALNSWKSMEKGAYDFTNGTWYGLDGSWVAASEQIVKYYMDPRNFINDNYIFMFENLSYDPSYQTIEGVKNILSGSFMSGNYTCPDTGEVKSYAETFMEAAKKSGVSPYHLAARCRNEQGVNGAPQSLGTVKGWENYFNFFDIQAYATSTMTAAQMGCRYAATKNSTYLLPWTNQYKSIVGGSIYLGTGYISKGQDTLYLQKFDMVDGGNGYYSHQYMTCVFGQANEAVSMKNAYSDEILATAMEFKIPVYDNMPESVCTKPTSGGDNNNYLKSLSVSGATISPTFDKFTNSYTATVSAETSSAVIYANALGSKATVSGTGSVSLKEGTNTVKITCKAASGATRTYTVKITRKKASSTLKQGDVNGDKYITVVDALLILRYNAGKTTLTSEQLARADMDSSGTVDVVDALTILKQISNS